MSGFLINKDGVNRQLLDTVKARKLAYYGHTMRKQGSCLEKKIMQGTINSLTWRHLAKDNSSLRN